MRRSLPIAVAVFLFIHVEAALAGSESWVSGSGTDTGTCPVTAPCRTFAYAHGQTTAQGAINVLSSGNFGPLTITKAISIVARDVEAVINTAAGGAGIIVQVPATAIVSLRGLTIDMRSTGNMGISFVSGKALHVQNSVIRKTQLGLRFAPTSGTSELYVADMAVMDSSGNGIVVNTTGSAAITAAFDRVRVENAVSNGIAFIGSGLAITATVRDSVMAGNGATGIVATANGSGTVNLMIEHTASVNNATGIAVFVGATVRMGNSTLTGNDTAIGGGPLFSYGTNKIDGNNIDSLPSIIPME